MKLFYFYIILIFNTNFLKSEETKIYNIVFLDVLEDNRYTKWGLHPVDIRSKLNKERRPLAGAKLGIEESKNLIRLTGTEFFLEHKRFKSYLNAISFLKSEKIDKFDAVLLDLDIKNIDKFKNIIKKKSYLLFFNVSDPKNIIRKELCLNNFFNTYPSNAMLTDSVAQYLVKKKLNKSLLLTGPLIQDNRVSLSFKSSAKKFGIRIVQENFFVNNNDPRVRDKNNLTYLTKGKKYNNVFVADLDGEFSLSVPNATMQPALVSGSAGLIANAWHWSYLRHGAPQLNGRFERMNNRRMGSKDWAAWISIKTIVESILRIKNSDNADIIKYAKSNLIKLDGSKGISLNYRIGTNQLRQTILLTSSNNWVTAKAPLEEFKDSKNNLNTIGISLNETNCNLEE